MSRTHEEGKTALPKSVESSLTEAVQEGKLTQDALRECCEGLIKGWKQLLPGARKAQEGSRKNSAKHRAVRKLPTPEKSGKEGGARE